MKGRERVGEEREERGGVVEGKEQKPNCQNTLTFGFVKSLCAL